VPAEPYRVVTTGLGITPRRLLRGTEQLQRLVGKRLLAGVTIRDRDGAIVTRRQFHGPVTSVADGVVTLQQDDGSEALLPADPTGYELARPGTYRLLSGDVVIDPDYLSVWEIAPGDEPPGGR
jgi:hypothetical protein